MQTSTSLNGYLQFPHVRQVFRILKTVTIVKSQKTTNETIYGITSLTPEKATGERLLALHRGHWSIENKSHYVRDVAYDEDRSQIRTKNGPWIMAAIRNFAVSLLRIFGVANIGKKLREVARRPHLALHMLGL